MMTYKVYYRINGQLDQAWFQADDELGARVKMHDRFGGSAQFVRAVVLEHDLIEDKRPPEEEQVAEALAEVIHVDFRAKKRIAS